MNIDTLQSVYFIGAGGIGMSALVRYFLLKGKFVAGYDRTPSHLTEQLIQEGAHLHFQEEVAQIPLRCKDKEHTLIIYTPAIPATHTELHYFRQEGFTIMKRAEVLGMLTRTEKGLCVAGTHGKTSTSTLTAHLLHASHVGCNAFLGGISRNYNTNLLFSAESEYVVIEADEFDRSFHHLRPYATVITSTDADHLDIYGTHEAYLESFSHYASLVTEGGHLIVKKGVQLSIPTEKSIHVWSYGIEQGDFRATNIRIANETIIFDYISPLGNIADIELGVPIYVNIENGVAAMALAQIAGVSPEEIKTAMASFRGIERRFDFRLRTPAHIVLSDYAHHPEELKQSIHSLRQLYPTRKLTGVFQPHLYSRTRDFYPAFAESLSLLDEVILLDIYPARELPIEGVSSQLIFDCLKSGVQKHLCRKEDLVATIQTCNPEVLMVLGAGDVDNYVAPIIEVLR
ncbi:MAG: Mur ligase family protein [Phocaeicola sp.]|nr:Mur ligase family protein [Phocaeicola sp.]